MFQKILNDQEIIDRYKEVEKYELESGGWAYHNLDHVLNVCGTVRSLLEKLNYNEEFIDNAMVACLLHDTGANVGKEGHTHRGYLYALDYLQRKNMKPKYLGQILEAIDIHSSGFDTDNVIALCLILADKLDVKSNRITEVGKNVIGNRQYKYVRDIEIDIKDNDLIINFLIDDGFNQKEVEEFYFTPKIFKAIRSFADSFRFNPSVLINGNEWEMFKNI